MFEINSFTRAAARTGPHILGHFVLAIAGLEIHGFALVRTEKNGLSVKGPRLDPDDRRRVEITDNALRAAIQRKAVAVYQMLGGTDLPEWALKSEMGA